jgi:hypothetical protein
MSARPRATYANVMSTLAVVLALTTGTAYAAHLGKNAVRSKNIASNAVKERHIADGSVHGSDLANGSVGSKALDDGGVATGDLAGNAVTGAKIADGSVASADLADNAVTSSKIANGAVGSSDLAANSVTDSALAANSVGSSEIKDGSITAVDVAPDSISSARMTDGVKNLLFNAGTLAVNQVFGDVTVTNGSWPAGAPSSGAPFTVTWSQPGKTLDVATGVMRISYPAACSQTASTPRGLDVKIVDAGGRVISASSAERTDGANYNGNGFWDQQETLPGTTFRAPSGSDLASDPAAFIDYVHLPFELAEFANDTSSDTSRTVRVYLKRSSSACSPTVTDARIIVYRYADQS